MKKNSSTFDSFKTTLAKSPIQNQAHGARNWSMAILFSGLVMVYSGQASASEDLKIGTVDMQKALQTVDSGKKAKSQLEKEFNAKKKELQSEESSIRKATEDFKKQSLVMSDEARAKKQGELQERIVKFQELTARSQLEIQQKEKELTQPIINHLKTIIAELAKKHAYTVVLEKNENSVLYSLEKDDLTGEVITNYDKQSKANLKDSG